MTSTRKQWGVAIALVLGTYSTSALAHATGAGLAFILFVALWYVPVCIFLHSFAAPEKKMRSLLIGLIGYPLSFIIFFSIFEKVEHNLEHNMNQVEDDMILLALFHMALWAIISLVIRPGKARLSRRP